jgi:hypothetical protein
MGMMNKVPISRKSLLDTGEAASQMVAEGGMM